MFLMETYKCKYVEEKKNNCTQNNCILAHLTAIRSLPPQVKVPKSLMSVVPELSILGKESALFPTPT